MEKSLKELKQELTTLKRERQKLYDKLENPEIALIERLDKKLQAKQVTAELITGIMPTSRRTKQLSWLDRNTYRYKCRNIFADIYSNQPEKAASEIIRYLGSDMFERLSYESSTYGGKTLLQAMYEKSYDPNLSPTIKKRFIKEIDEINRIIKNKSESIYPRHLGIPKNFDAIVNSIQQGDTKYILSAINEDPTLLNFQESDEATFLIS